MPKAAIAPCRTMSSSTPCSHQLSFTTSIIIPLSLGTLKEVQGLNRDDVEMKKSTDKMNLSQAFDKMMSKTIRAVR